MRQRWLHDLAALVHPIAARQNPDDPFVGSTGTDNTARQRGHELGPGSLGLGQVVSLRSELLGHRVAEVILYRFLLLRIPLGNFQDVGNLLSRLLRRVRGLRLGPQLRQDHSVGNHIGFPLSFRRVQLRHNGVERLGRFGPRGIQGCQLLLLFRSRYQDAAFARTENRLVNVRKERPQRIEVA